MRQYTKHEYRLRAGHDRALDRLTTDCTGPGYVHFLHASKRLADYFNSRARLIRGFERLGERHA